jgi:hypothetical protein
MTDTPDRRIPPPPKPSGQPVVGSVTLGAMTRDELTRAERLWLSQAVGDIARLTRERDAARAECRAWRMDYDEKISVHDQAGVPVCEFPSWHPVSKAMTAHDSACPGWEEAK